MAARIRWTMGARSETGYVRTTNEDRMGWTRAVYGDVYVVADGMGGYRGGALAAELTVAMLEDQLARIAANADGFGDALRQAFLAANDKVFSRRDPANPETRDMGAAAVALITSGSRCMVAHVGDCRAYLWRPALGLRLLTRDHTRVQSMLDAGLLTPEQAAVHPDASLLERAIGHQATIEADVSEWIPLESGDMLLLCSDGLSGYVADAEIARILEMGEEAQVSTDRLIESALRTGGQDNVTVQLLGYALVDAIPAGSPSLRSGELPTCLLAALGSGLVVGLAAYLWYGRELSQVHAELTSLRTQMANTAASPGVVRPASSLAPPAGPTAASPQPAAGNGQLPAISAATGCRLPASTAVPQTRAAARSPTPAARTRGGGQGRLASDRGSGAAAPPLSAQRPARALPPPAVVVEPADVAASPASLPSTGERR